MLSTFPECFLFHWYLSLNLSICNHLLLNFQDNKTGGFAQCLHQIYDCSYILFFLQDTVVICNFFHAAGYQIEMAPVKGRGGWVAANQMRVTMTEFTVTNLIQDSEWEFRAIAINEAGPSKPSKSTGPHRVQDPVCKYSIWCRCYIYFTICFKYCFVQSVANHDWIRKQFFILQNIPEKNCKSQVDVNKNDFKPKGVLRNLCEAKGFVSKIKIDGIRANEGAKNIKKLLNVSMF